MQKLSKVILTVTAIFTLSGCSQQNNSQSQKKPLVLEFVPSNNNSDLKTETHSFSKYLSKKLHRTVKIHLSTDRTNIVEAMQSKKIDIGIMPPASFVQAQQNKSAVGLLTAQRLAYNPQTEKLEKHLADGYKAEVIAKTDSKINKLSDLKNRKITTLDANSASGYIYPAVELKKLGINLEKDNKTIVVNDIPSEITAVLNNQVDAAFVFQGARQVFNGKVGNSDLYKSLKVVALSKANIPNDVIAVKTQMDPKLQKQVKRVFQQMPHDPAGKKAMKLWNHNGYAPFKNSDFQTMASYIKQAKSIKQ